MTTQSFQWIAQSSAACNAPAASSADKKRHKKRLLLFQRHVENHSSTTRQKNRYTARSHQHCTPATRGLQKRHCQSTERVQQLERHRETDQKLSALANTDDRVSVNLTGLDHLLLRWRHKVADTGSHISSLTSSSSAGGGRQCALRERHNAGAKVSW